ncbi:MAG: polyprenyl synthetase family protein [Candidatus Sumerlaeaceae bacterium]
MKTVTKSGELIEEIAGYLAHEMAGVESLFDSVLDSETELICEVGRYVRAGQGKRLRPMLVLLASSACGYKGTDDAKVAAAIEMVHTATLLHDDVIDKAPLRRGRPTVNARWGDDVAILVADFLYARAFTLAMQVVSPLVLSTICQVTTRMCEGEMFQIQKRDAILSRMDYLRVIRSKTAFLFSACTGLGAVLANKGEEETLELTKFGLNFGMAFQISDDALDFVAEDSDLGKQHGTDIRNGKQTLPLIHTFETASKTDREALLACWNNGREPAEIMWHVRKYEGVETALAEARNYADAAKSHLQFLEPSRAAEFFVQLSDYVADRSY